MNEKIVNEGATLKLKTYTGTVKINPALSVKGRFKVGGKSCYNSLAFTVTAATNGTVSEGVGAGVIVGNSQKVKSGGLPVVLADAESATVILTGTTDTPPYTGAFEDTIIILTPGQNKVGAK